MDASALAQFRAGSKTMKTKNHFDYFVIGAGSGGVRSARIAASFGAKVGIAEYKATGGTCVNVGCVPKKLMTYAADYRGHFEDSKGYGWSIGSDRDFSWETFITRKDKEILRLNGIYDGVLEKAGVTHFKAKARFIAPHILDVGGEEISADKILIATGGKPRQLDIPGGDYALSSDDIFYLKTQPKHIIILGGGYIAVEFAQIFAGLGSKVTLCYRGDLFLKGFDKDIRETLADEMKKSGVELLFDYTPSRIEKTPDGLCLSSKNHDDIKADVILSAIGRVPNTSDLGLDKAGVQIDETGKIMINQNFETSAPHIFALGDVANTHNLTPVAIKEGHILARRLFGGEPDLAMNYNLIPTAVFSQPPIGTVGHTEESAIASGHEIRTFKTRFRAMRHILAERQEFTVMKLIVCAKTDKVLGAHIIGLDAPEILQGFAVALTAGATKADFDNTIGIHPTIAEEFVTMR